METIRCGKQTKNLRDVLDNECPEVIIRDMLHRCNTYLCVVMDRTLFTRAGEAVCIVPKKCVKKSLWHNFNR